MAASRDPQLPPVPRCPAPTTWEPSQRNGAQMMADTLAQWHSLGPRADLWVFGYASLVWRPEFEAAGLDVIPAPTAWLGGGDSPGDAQPLPFAPSQNTAYAAWFALHELLGRLAYRWSR